MKRTMKLCASVLAISAMTSQAFASVVCTKAAEATALKAETLQQQLMVAALTCNAAEPYNRFVIAWRGELVDSDRAAQGFFQRVNGSSGFSDYQTYKTKLANDFSLDSMHDTDSFCATARTIFAAADSEHGARLGDFVASLNMSGDEPYAQCEERGASEEMVAGRSSGPLHRSLHRRD